MYKPLAVQLLFSSAMLVAASWPHFEYPEEVPVLERRQEPGTTRYQCHEDCGLLITLGRQDGYCNNSEWNERYGRCMICANTFGIWEYYGNSVTKAAKGCGLSPTPNPSGMTASSTSAGEPSTTAAGKTSTSTAPGQTSAIKTSSAAQTTGQSGSAVTSNAASTAGQISNASTLSTASTRTSGLGVSSGPSSTPVTPPRPSGSSTATPLSPVQSAAAGHVHFATPLMAAVVIALAGLC